MLKDFSDEIAALGANWTKRLVHIGGRGISGRSGIMLEAGIVVSLARQASENEEIEILDTEGKTHKAIVAAFDYRTGLVVLRSPELGKGLSRLEAGSKANLGELCLLVAHPSPGGPEIVLSNVRFKGQETEWGGVVVGDYFQTAGLAFPGFGSGLVISARGTALGVIVHNQQGNEGWVLGIKDWLDMADDLLKNGSYKKPTIGVRLVLTDLNAHQSKIADSSAGLLIQSIDEKSPAQSADFRTGDIIIAVDGKPIGPGPLFSRSKPAQVKILRGETVLTIEVVPR